MKNIIIACCLLFSGIGFAQTSITVDSVFQTSTCAGGNVIIPFSYTGTFPFGNVFTAELSDMWGSFANPSSMGTTMFVIGGNGIIFGTISATANFGFLYRVRVVSSNPVDTSSTSLNTLIITQVAQLNQIVSNPGDSVCPGDTVTLTAINIATSYLWSTNDTTNSIMVTQSGAYSVTTTDALGCESTAYDTVLFDIAFCVGIEEQNAAAALQLFPNPANGTLNISFNDSYGNDSYFELMNVTGQVVRRDFLRQNSTGSQQVDLAGIALGVYVFALHVNGQTVERKVVVQ